MKFLTNLFKFGTTDARYEKLLEENARFQRIFEGSHKYGFVDWDLESDVITWHGGYWQSLGYNEKDMAKMRKPATFVEFIHPDDIVGVRETVRKHLKNELKSQGLTFRVKKKHGGHVWTEVRVDTHRDSSGWVKFMSGVVFDITVLKQTEHALQESEARHARIIRASNDGIWEWSAENQGFMFSSRCWEQIGFTEEDIASKKEMASFARWRERMHPEDAVEFDKTLSEHLIKKGPFDIEYRIRGKDEEWRWVRARGHMTFTENDEPSLMSGTIMDITELKMAEKRVLEAKEGAEVANKAKSEFLSAMSHELRTPLNAILGFAQLFDLDHNLTEDQRDNVMEIKGAGRHLLKLVGDVLDLSKIESGRTEFNVEKISPVRVIHSCINLVKPQADSRSIRIEFNERSFEDHIIEADSIRIKQVLLNLISNAIKYNVKSGTVKIYCDVSNNGIMKISVEDTGKGIPVKYQNDLFQPFNRLGAEKSNIEGSGVGLVISKELTEHMGGEIGYKTAENIGTTFWVCFPVCCDDEVEDCSDAAVLETNLPELLVSEEKSVLYVEDNPSNQRLMSQLLNKFPLLQLRMAEQALQGLFLARTEHPDLIILDINLPGMNGYEMVEVLKNDPLTKEIPVIALSANAMAHDIEKGKSAGFDYYLTKPIDLSQLIVVCNSVLV